ncbi:cyclic nucleotide-binding domain-containing protein [Candidatus Haliotispira prima]|uniref:Cyclic nucleotide-binding domain-containing protein n=1 Tax=Candidatus Haliotispira prima TaxID=3034016 RepID=A0ABY8MJV9_9SPIO|nr:cyclic nucleotide-binding domain-containing protein [Candidatus Haliotispira prima]
MTPKNSSLSVVRFQAGSYILIEDQSNDEKNQEAFFILQSGSVQVETLVDQMLGRQSHVLGPGGFFGVIGAMSARQSNETVVALTDCSMIMVKRSKFADLVAEAPAIAFKIIRSLSNDLRHYDNELASRMVDENHSSDNAINLFRVGEFFYNNNNFSHATHVFICYLEHHHDVEHRRKAQSYLHKMKVKITIHNGFNRIYEDGEMICAEFMPGSELYIIQSGKVKITKIINGQEIVLAILDAGEIVGEMSLLNDKDRTANIIAYGETKIMAVDKTNSEKIILENKELAKKLLIVLADRLWTMYKQLANLLIEDPLTRLWDTLSTQLLKQHIRFGRRIPYEFPFRKTELLNMCGLSKDVGETAFKELMDDRNMSLAENGMIYCRDLEELSKTVESAHKIELRTRKVRLARQKNSEGRS